MPKTGTPTFDTFGAMLSHLRRRARLTQQELGIAVGYSESYITRLEGDSRHPVPAMIRSRFVDALDLRNEPALAQQLIALAEAAKGPTLAETTAAPKVHAPARRGNLPAHLTRFIGRERELAEVEQLVQTHRLVTLTGSGGVGKTRLAQHAAAGMLDRLADGAWLIELAPLADAARVPHTAVSAFRLPNALALPPIEALCGHLADKHALLVLDNCEHLIQACAELAEAVLRACPRMHILATSREALHVPGEVTWRVPPMDVEASVQLFADRAAAAKPGFVVDDQAAAIVAAIGQRLDGIPLAIELAAARVSGLSVEQLAARLGDRFRLLTDGSRTALPRHQTLRALIDWSYDLLTDQERELFRRLAVFAGGWTAEAAEQVCASPQSEDGKTPALFAPNVLPLLLHLVSKSLVIAEERGAETRFRLLETIREYASGAARHSDADGETHRLLRQRHLEYYGDLAQVGLLIVPDGSWHWVWNDDLAAEIDNTRAALAWAAQSGDWRTGWRLLTGTHGVWTVLGYGDELIAWAARNVVANPMVDEATRVSAQMVIGRLEFERGDIAASIDRYRTASERAHRLGDERLILEADSALGFLAPDSEESTRLLKGVIELAHRTGHKSSEVEALRFLAARMGIRGEQQGAYDVLAASLRLARETGSTVTLAGSLESMGRLLFERGDLVGARAMIEEAAALNREAGLLGWLHANLEDLAEVGLHQGDGARVRQALSETVPYYYRTHDAGRTARGLAVAAGLARLQGRPAQAARLLSAVAALLHRHEAPGIFESELTAEYLRLLPLVREELDPTEFALAWAEGHTWTLEHAIEEALED